MSLPKPRLINISGREYWSAPQLRMVEYLLQEHQVLRAKEVEAFFNEQFGTRVHRVSIARHLAKLLEEKRVVKLNHGLYAHITSVYL